MPIRSSSRSMRQSYDWSLVIFYLLLIVIGWINIYASIHSSEPSSIIAWSARSGKQFVWILTSLGLAGLILFVLPPRLWESGSIPFYVGVLFLLVAVIFLGIEVKGSRSWFEFGPVRFQPAEISKITTSLMLAFLMSRANYRITKLRDFMIAAIIVGLPMLIIVAESETGSALVYVGFIFMFYREGLSGWFLAVIGIAILLFILTLTASPFTAVLVLLSLLVLFNAFNGRFWRTILLGGIPILLLALIPAIRRALVPGAEGGIPYFRYIIAGLSVVAIPILLVRAYKIKSRFLTLSVAGFIAGIMMIMSADIIFNDVLQEHQRKRIEVLLGMKEDPSGVGYNVNQSMIAIGSGGLTGKGYLNGTQTTYGFVPEQSTDFIFCTVGEEWGFLGCTVVILLYFLLIWRIVQDAEHSREAFTRIYGYCVASCLFMHLFINIGMTIGLMPVIGIPLPMMSYGGSSLWAFTVMIFIFVALDHEERKYF
ncbi:MAG: rod shape-determining protein RodA [Bacteroidales bacterium]|nr:rod shape-determining protein RodA [Bacteroidales bacterium]MBP5235421.1 rod shape-determining protein RodA [Bacteroidales bacterium]MBQ2525325.1 rod shape-determining protein RodA [Bacteroidales bacterium]MBQ5528061.1 rod shape-determining protein RodA [Bacteroidales bacterium]MBR6362093.1 rod shape-determining protein RodA [Bacteroidales bacterium]